MEVISSLLTFFITKKCVSVCVVSALINFYYDFDCGVVGRRGMYRMRCNMLLHV